jgi:2-polyprenyl-3-methyl-5-hydroxy-6-metoxy-1,4-benzoquinol methylase
VSAVNYRQSLYDQYISSHFTNIRQISIDSLKGDRKFVRAYFGRHLPTNKAAVIADLGCGYGGFLQFLKQEGYANVIGVDKSREQVEAAHEFGIQNIQYQELAQFVIERPGAFDCVTAIDVLEHFSKEEILPVLKSVYDALRPGGSFLMQAPNAASPFFGRIRYGDFTHSVAFTRASAVQLLIAAGFTDVEVYPTGPVVHGVLSAGRWLLWKAIEFLLRVYLVAETGMFRGHILTENLIVVAHKSPRSPGERIQNR